MRNQQCRTKMLSENIGAVYLSSYLSQFDDTAKELPCWQDKPPSCSPLVLSPLDFPQCWESLVLPWFPATQTSVDLQKELVSPRCCHGCWHPQCWNARSCWDLGRWPSALSVCWHKRLHKRKLITHCCQQTMLTSSCFDHHVGIQQNACWNTGWN